MGDSDALFKRGLRSDVWGFHPRQAFFFVVVGEVAFLSPKFEVFEVLGSQLEVGERDAMAVHSHAPGIVGVLESIDPTLLHGFWYALVGKAMRRLSQESVWLKQGNT